MRKAFYVLPGIGSTSSALPFRSGPAGAAIKPGPQAGIERCRQRLRLPVSQLALVAASQAKACPGAFTSSGLSSWI